MTTLELNAELAHCVSLIADDEDSLKKAISYLKKLVSKKNETAGSEIPNKTTLKAMKDAENNINLEKVDKASDLLQLLSD